jgi:hypothetical protein
METINNVAQAAAKAVWGETKEEPVSGKTGDTSKGEPYDAGNMGSKCPGRALPWHKLCQAFANLLVEPTISHLNYVVVRDIDY